jgi:uncharacterized protein YhdP
MSHTVLSAASHRTNRNNTALYEVMGTLEVYWEQLKSASLLKRWRGTASTTDQQHEEIPTHETEEDSNMNAEWRKAKLRHASRAEGRSRFIEANVVFG